MHCSSCGFSSVNICHAFYQTCSTYCPLHACMNSHTLFTIVANMPEYVVSNNWFFSCCYTYLLCFIQCFFKNTAVEYIFSLSLSPFFRIQFFCVLLNVWIINTRLCPKYCFSIHHIYTILPFICIHDQNDWWCYLIYLKFIVIKTAFWGKNIWEFIFIFIFFQND